jgi:pimeloyl-ACP methyl ester carboxylesterase
VVLVHGALHGSWVWEPIEADLHSRGIKTITIDLPSIGHRGDTLPGITADVAALTDLLDSTAGRKVVVGHSYGGAVVTGATAGRSDIEHLVYEAAFAPDAGQTTLDVFEPLPTWMGPNDDYSYMEMKTDDLAGIFYGNTPPDIAEWAVAHLDTIVQGVGIGMEPLAAAGWHDHPSTYVVSTQDHAVDVGLQRKFASRMTHVFELPTDHSAMLSATKELADIIEGTIH